MEWKQFAMLEDDFNPTRLGNFLSGMETVDVGLRLAAGNCPLGNFLSGMETTSMTSLSP